MKKLLAALAATVLSISTLTASAQSLPPPTVAGRAMPPDFTDCYAASFAPIAGQLAVYLGSVDEAQEVTHVG